jgi:DNA modification methylase
MTYELLTGDARDVLATLPPESVQCVVTSPPYFGLRDYGTGEAQIGLESTPDEYVAALVSVFRGVRRVLRDDGTVWLNLGDSYANTGNPGQDFSKSKVGYGGRGRGVLGGQPSKDIPPGLKPKDLVGVPWRVAFALQADGWYLRQDIIWHKPNPMPESVTDRCTKAHEYVFLLSKSARYYYDADAIKEPVLAASAERASKGFRTSSRDGEVAAVSIGANERTRFGLRETFQMPDARNKRSVWTVPTAPYPEAHFATYPPELIRPCIQAGTRPGDTVLDPFSGSGTTGLVALQHGRRYIGIDLNPEYHNLAHARLAPLAAQPRLLEATA